MQIKKQNVNVGKAIFSGDIKTGADGNIIVPDVKPDILKVLQVDAESFLEEKTIENGKLILKGKVNINVLYIPENEEDHVQCLNGTFEFCETVKKSEFEQGMDVVAVCDTGKVGYRLINSRKIGFEAQVLINVTVTSEEGISFICDIDSERAEIIKNNICVKEASLHKEFALSIDETVDLPYNNVTEILKGTATITEKDCRSITGKLIVKGKVCATVLYVTENRTYEHMDFEMPFTEVFDWENINEDCDCELVYDVKEAEFKLKNGTEDEKKCISACIQVSVTAFVDNFQNLQYINDCYFTDSLCSLEYSNLVCEDVCAKPIFSNLVKHIIEKEENLPYISGIYTTVAKPYITSTDVQDGRISVSGKISICILYLSDDPQNPLSGLTEEVPFSHMIECANATQETEVLLKIECEHISCILNSSNSIEVRCGICTEGKVIKKNEIRVIKEITLLENKEKEKAMVVYFSKKGDTVWNIGKRYGVKCQDIKDCNHLEDGEELVSGQKIVIPVSK